MHQNSQDRGIRIHGMFVPGAGTDDAGIIRGTADVAMDLGIDSLQIMILTPLPGTSLFQETAESGKLLHTDWSKYDVQHVAFRPLLVSPASLQTETLRSMGRFYSWKYIFRRLAGLDLSYAAIGLFGKAAVAGTLKAASAYLDGPGFSAG